MFAFIICVYHLFLDAHKNGDQSLADDHSLDDDQLLAKNDEDSLDLRSKEDSGIDTSALETSGLGNYR